MAFLLAAHPAAGPARSENVASQRTVSLSNEWNHEGHLPGCEQSAVRLADVTCVSHLPTFCDRSSLSMLTSTLPNESSQEPRSQSQSSTRRIAPALSEYNVIAANSRHILEIQLCGRHTIMVTKKPKAHFDRLAAVGRNLNCAAPRVIGMYVRPQIRPPPSDGQRKGFVPDGIKGVLDGSRPVANS